MGHLVVGRGPPRRALVDSAAARGLCTRPLARAGRGLWVAGKDLHRGRYGLQCGGRCCGWRRWLAPILQGGRGPLGDPSLVGLSEACDPLVAGISARFVCQGLGPLEAGDRDVVALSLSAGPPEHEVHEGLVHALPRDGEVPEG